MYFDVGVSIDIANITADLYGDTIIRHYNAAGTELMNWVNITESGITAIRQTPVGLGILCNSNDYFQIEELLQTDTSVDVTTRSEFSIFLRGQ